MKKLSLALLITSLLANARADITTGLVGYWTLSDGPGSSTVADSSGNGNIGTLVNFTDLTYNNMWTTSTDPTNGWTDALLFNQSGEGANTYVSIPDSPSIDLASTAKQWTLSAWVNCSVAGGSEPANAGIISKGNLNLEAFALYMSGGKFTTIFHNAAGSGVESVASTTTPAAGTWYHVVATVLEPKGSATAEAIVYVNGIRESGANANTYTTVYVTNLPVVIGCRAAANGVFNLPFQGTIDEVRIYDRALTSSDVLELYQNKAFSLFNNGIGSWNGLAGSGGNAALDSSSLNFCTNLYTAPLGTPGSLASVLNLETADSLPAGSTFADVYYNSGIKVAVASTNLTIAAGGVAFATATAPGKLTFQNSIVTYILNSSDSNGIKDGANPTSLLQSGTGTVILTGTNTFSGGATINSGTVQLGNGGAVTGQELGTATTVTDNGVLAFNGNNSVNFNTSITGNGAVTQKGSGTLTLGGNNTYANSTTIATGTLSASSIGDSGSSSIGTGTVTLNGGTLIYTGGGDSTARQINGTPGTINTIDVPNGVTVELSGRVTASAAWVINKVDTGTLTLSGSGDNSFLGMNVNAGTVILNKTSGAGHAIGNPLNVASGATVQLSGGGYTGEIFNSVTAPVTINSGGVLDANGQNDTFSTLNLSGTGIGGTGALINSASSTTAALTCGVNLAASTTVGGAGSITLAGTVGGSGSLTYAGSGLLVLGGANTYAGGTVVNAGTLDGSVPGSIPGNVTVSGTGVLQIDDPSAIFPTATLTLPASPAANTVNLNFGGTQNIAVLIIGGTAMPAGTYGAVGSGAANTSATFAGPGILNVAEPFWDANGTDASSGTGIHGGGSGSWDNSAHDWWLAGNVDSTWTANNNAFFAGTAGTVTVNANVTADGLFFSTAGYTITNTDGVSVLTLGGANPIIAVPTGTTTVACSLGGGGTTTGLTATGPGTLVLSGNNTYGDGTVINNNATLSVNNISDSGTSAIGSSGNLTLSSGALAYTGAAGASTARTVSSPAGTTNTINVTPGSSLELDGSITGTTTSVINKTGTGTLILGGVTDNSGLNMNINGGEVIINKTSASNVHGLGGGLSSVASGAELELSGSGNFGLFAQCVLTVSSGGVVDLNSESDGMSTLNLSGSGIGGAGALINSTTTATSFLTNGGSGVVLSGPVTVGGVGNITLVSVVGGSGASLTYAGTGVLTLTNANTYSGGTTINPGGTVSLGGSAASAGTGAITDSGTLNVGILGNNVILANAISGTGVVNVVETSGNNLQLGGSMAGFTGTLNLPSSPGGAAKAQILTPNVNISSAATINLAAGGTLYVANSGVVIPCPVNIYGLGNTEVYGALRIESNAVISGAVTLHGSTTMGNGHGGAVIGTISGPISETNGSFGIAITAEPGTIVLSGTNTFTGPTSISNTSGGQLVIGGAGMLGGGNYAGSITNNATLNYNSSAAQTLSGVMSGTGLLIQSGPGNLALSGTNSFIGGALITNGSALTISGSGSLGATGTSNSYPGNITNLGNFTYASSSAQTLSGIISGTGALTDSGTGPLTLSAPESYTGTTTVGTGATLALSSSGSINASPLLNLPAGGSFDVSAYGLSFILGGGTTLRAAGTGTSVGSTAATVKGGASATVNIASLVLSFAPQTFSGDTTHPALYVSQGSLNLSGTGITVSNATATPLGAGTYSLVQVANNNLSVASANVTVTGAGLAAGATASLAVSGGTLNLVVATTGTPAPDINSVAVSGSNLIFSGTNGQANASYVVLSSTNVALPLNQWTPIATNTFSGTGAFSVTNPIGAGKQFFDIEIPGH